MPGFFSSLFYKPSPTETQIWACGPLVIVHADDGVVYGEHTDVEFTPDDASGRTGHAIALKPAPDGWQPEIWVESVEDAPASTDVRTRPRGGAVVRGNDSEGEPFVWYIDAAADRYLTLEHRPEGEPKPPAIAPRGSPAEANLEMLTQLTERALDDARATVVYSDLLIILAAGDELAYSGSAEIRITPLEGRIDIGYAELMGAGGHGASGVLRVARAETNPEGFQGLSLRGLNGLGEESRWLTDEVAVDHLAMSQGDAAEEP